MNEKQSRIIVHPILKVRNHASIKGALMVSKINSNIDPNMEVINKQLTNSNTNLFIISPHLSDFFIYLSKITTLN
jgi:hypothetical protein